MHKGSMCLVTVTVYNGQVSLEVNLKENKDLTTQRMMNPPIIIPEGKWISNEKVGSKSPHITTLTRTLKRGNKETI